MKYINTQNDELLIVQNLIEINLVEGEGEDENRTARHVYAVVASDVAGKEHTLGVYLEEKEARKCLLEIGIWLDRKQTLFSMPIGKPSKEQKAE